MARPKRNAVVLTEEQRTELKRLSRAKGTSATAARRCRVLLELDGSDGRKPGTYTQIAASTGVSQPTVCSMARRFAEGGIENAIPHRINPKSADSIRKVDGRIEAEIFSIACSDAPAGRCRWTLELVAKRVNERFEEQISDETVRRVLKKGGLSLTG